MADRLDLEQLRAAMGYGWKDWHYGDSLHDTDIGALDTILGAVRFLLSLADSGGRLVVETPCDHGNTSPHYFDDDMISFEDWGDYIRCDRDDCALEHVRPGKVQCECDSHGTPYDTGFGPQGGERKPSCPGGFTVVWPTDKEEK